MFSPKNSCQMERITGQAWHWLTYTVCSHEMLSCTIWGLYQQPNQTKRHRLCTVCIQPSNKPISSSCS